MQWRRHRSSDAPSMQGGLARETETALVLRYQSRGDTAARDILVNSHLRLVRRFARYYARHGSSFEDLQQEGGLALMRAVETFSPDHNTRFATYAAYWIRARMQHAVAQWRSHWYGAPASLVYPTDPKRYPGARQLLRMTLSLDAPIQSDGETSVGAAISSAEESVEAQVAGRETSANLHLALAKAINKLDDRRAALLCEQRLLSDQPVTLEKLGAQFNLSREGVRLLELRLKLEIKNAMGEWAA